MKKQQITDYFNGDYLAFYRKYLPDLKKKGKQYAARCCFHEDKKPSLSIDPQVGLFKCFGCDAKGDIFEFYSKLHSISGFPETIKGIANDFGIPLEVKKTKTKAVATYDYTDLDGNLIHQTVRYADKSFKQRRPDGKGGWIWNLKDIEPVLYRLPDVAKADEVIICEGEKDCDNLKKIGPTATTNPMGAGKWRECYNQYLKGKDIAIIPDNDEPGKQHAEAVARSIINTAKSIKVIQLPDLGEGQDVSDFLSKFSDSDEAAERLSLLIDQSGPYKPKIYAQGREVIGYSAKEVMQKEFPAPKWAIPGILPEGLTMLAGKPKHGKSIMAMNFGISIASGAKALGSIDVEGGTVLYLALEDTFRRIKQRLKTMLAYGGDPPEKLLIYTEWGRIYEGGINFVEDIIKQNSDMRLVIIDTLPKFRPPKPPKMTLYEWDYDVGVKLKQLADIYSVPVLVLCHLRKAESEDRMDDVSGTFGVTGAADGTLLLVRKTGSADAELHISGRDVEATEYALNFDPATLSWNLLGRAAEVKATREQQTLFDALRLHQAAATPTELADGTGLPLQYVKNTLPKLIKSGDVKKVGHGKYLSVSDKKIINFDDIKG